MAELASQKHRYGVSLATIGITKCMGQGWVRKARSDGEGYRSSVLVHLFS